MIDVYVFDCDGVIIDSGADICACVNAALAHFGFAEVPERTMVTFTGDGARALVERALSFSTGGAPVPTGKADDVLRWYLACYQAHPVARTRLCPGIPRLLRTLTEKGKHVAMLTNKPTDIALKILAHFGIAQYFDVVAGPEQVARMKPSPDGLFYAVSEINRAAGTGYGAGNVLMTGDSDVDIMAGKAYGCLTCGVTDGLGNREKMLAARPDFTFPVAGELEKYIGVLSAEGKIPRMEAHAMAHSVPIVQDDAAAFICAYIAAHGVRRVLELGTATGVSAIRFARAAPGVRVTTLEIDAARAEEARRNVGLAGLSAQVSVVCADALTADVPGAFDLIFIDAAKGQYRALFERYAPLLAPGGAIICDNLSFHGMVDDLSLTHNYSTKKLVKKLRKFVGFLKESAEFTTEFHPCGDGISVSRRLKD